MDISFNGIYYTIEYGGNIIIFEYLFWLFGHPEVYVIIIPVFGIIILCIYLEMIGISSMLGLISVLCSTICIAMIGFLVWAHHLYAIGLELDTSAIFSCLTLTISIPTGIKVLHISISICRV